MTDRRTLRRRFLVLLAVRWFQSGLQVPVLVLLLQSRGLDLAAVGAITAIYGLTTVLFELPTGGLADVIGRRPVLIVSASLFAVESMAFGFGQTFAVLAAGAALGGLGRALDSGPLEAWYVDRVRALAPGSDLQAGLSRAKATEAAGLAAGALAGGGLAVIDLTVPFAVSAVICIGMIVGVVAWVHEPARTSRLPARDVLRGVPATMWTGVGTALGHSTVRRVTVLSAGLGVALTAVELLTPVSLADILGSGDGAAGTYAVLATVGFLGSAAGSAAAPRAARLIGSPAATITAGRLLAAAALLGLATSSFAVTAVAFVAFYTVLGVTRPLISQVLHDAVPATERATALSAQSLTMQLSGVVASLTIGRVAQSVSLAAGFAIAAGALATAVAVRLPAHRPRRPQPVPAPR